MCLLIFMRPNVTVDSDELRVAAINNPDGFGWAVVGTDRIHVGKSMKFEEALNGFVAARAANQSGEALFHLRISTHGTTSLDNCHPFYVGDEQTVLAHNGMLPIKGDHRSDTRIFAEEWLPELGVAAMLDVPENRADLEKFARGSKLVVLSLDPLLADYSYILNESDGHWGKGSADGIWYSNESYQYVYRSYSYTPTPSRFGWAEWTEERDGTYKYERKTAKSFAPADGKWHTKDELDAIFEEGLDVSFCDFCNDTFVFEYATPEVCPRCDLCAKHDAWNCKCTLPLALPPATTIVRQPETGFIGEDRYITADGVPCVWGEVECEWRLADAYDYPLFQDHISWSDWEDRFPQFYSDRNSDDTFFDQQRELFDDPTEIDEDSDEYTPI